MLSTWYSNNAISENKRAVLQGVMVAIANSSGLISSNIFRAQDAPAYIPALATSAAIGGLTAVLAFTFGMYMRRENWKRNAEQGLPKSYGSKDVPTEMLGKGPSEPGMSSQDGERALLIMFSFPILVLKVPSSLCLRSCLEFCSECQSSCPANVSRRIQ